MGVGLGRIFRTNKLAVRIILLEGPKGIFECARGRACQIPVALSLLRRCLHR